MPSPIQGPTLFLLPETQSVHIPIGADHSCIVRTWGMKHHFPPSPPPPLPLFPILNFKLPSQFITTHNFMHLSASPWAPVPAEQVEDGSTEDWVGLSVEFQAFPASLDTSL